MNQNNLIFNELMSYKDLINKIGFNSKDYFSQKVEQIVKFFVNNEIKSCIIPLSGGVDSTLTALLVANASYVLDNVSFVNIPIRKFTSNQSDSTKLSKKLYKKLFKEYNKNNFEFKIFDITKSTKKIYNLFDIEENLPTWEGGQLASVMRTPLLYGYNSVLNKKYGKSVIIGTINKDEEYLGFFGKASDAMVDAIFISDLHKYQIYNILNDFKDIIPKKIILREPTGDCYDNRTDLEMIGGTYNDVLMSYYSNNKYTKEGITNLLNENKHKHEVGRPYHRVMLDQKLFTNL